MPGLVVGIERARADPAPRDVAPAEVDVIAFCEVVEVLRHGVDLVVMSAMREGRHLLDELVAE